MYADMDTASSLVKHSNGAIGLVKEGETLASHLCREAERTGYSFCVVNLLSPIYTPYSAGSDLLKPPTFIEQNHVTIHEQEQMIPMGLIIGHTDLLESDSLTERVFGEKFIDIQVSYALYLGVNTLYFKLPSKSSNTVRYPANLARLINGKLSTHQALKICIVMDVGFDFANTCCEVWDYIRTLCCYNKNLFVVPSIHDIEGVNIVKSISDDNVHEIWINQMAIDLGDQPRNHHNFPESGDLLSRDAIFDLLKISTRMGIIAQNIDNDMQKAFEALKSCIIKYSSSYAEEHTLLGVDPNLYDDYLQYPLQPLADNLDCSVYKAFEMDATKYDMYGEAIQKALAHMNNLRRGNSAAKCVVMVLGAGRGPLVTSIVDSINSLSYGPPSSYVIYAIEKNPSAVTTLKKLNQTKWSNKVDIIYADMRIWKPKQKVDIVVSELLGSFGDNELSPECLCLATKYLKDDGICIPKSYSSYISLASCAKYHHALSSIQESSNSLEVPYVVKLKSPTILTEPKFVWSFTHHRESTGGPRDPSKCNESNDRYASIEFHMDKDATVHGMVGYFDAELYEGVNISIVNGSSTPGMHSWFPMFFPLKRPIRVKRGDTTTARLWRLSCSTGVWYEWCLSKEEHIYNEMKGVHSSRHTEATGIHNSRGTKIMWRLHSNIA